MSRYEIFALKYAGPVKKCGAHLMWQKDWDKAGAGNFYFWCVKNHERTIIVDTGVAPALAAKRGLPNFIDPANLITRLGLKANSIEHVIITHLHWDHAGGAKLFPRAVFYVNEKEYLFWARDKAALTPPFEFLSDKSSINYLKGHKKRGRLVLVKKDQQLFPGISVMAAPGHSPGLMAVVVNTQKGRAVIGSDAAYVFKNYEQNWPSDIMYNMADSIRSLARLQHQASSPVLLFPGHDIKMAEDFPEVANNITRLA
ncbi:MAG: N-acyl homoserine lactonase family protein [Candidatus Margulisbacteria bacterium]|nr:N-acyl homoserine lactonase family protein [Candidatus Margulisiibacteriota bacterium]